MRRILRLLAEEGLGSAALLRLGRRAARAEVALAACATTVRASLDATHTNIARDGIDSKSTMQAPSGTYRLRQVVQEVVGGKLSAISRTVEIR